MSPKVIILQNKSKNIIFIGYRISDDKWMGSGVFISSIWNILACRIANVLIDIVAIEGSLWGTFAASGMAKLTIVG
jgi:hypothetical protein